jgi:hypothetical protein
MKEATSLKEGRESVASRFVVPVYCKRLQIKRTHHRAFGPASEDRFMNGFVEAAGELHSSHTLDKWIHFRQADGRKLGMHLEHQGFGRYSF